MKIPKFFFLIFALLLFHFCSGQKENINPAGLSKEYAILGAQLANQSYTFSKLGYSVNSKRLVVQNIDTAIYFIKQSIVALDSAIFYACDSDLLALDYANLAKKYAIYSYRTLMASKQYKEFLSRQELAKQAALLSAHTVTDAYHASFYFLHSCGPEELPKTTEKAKESPTAKELKQVTKLDIDQTLFTLLTEHLNEKSDENKKEILRLSEELKTEKDTLKAIKIQTQLKNIQESEKEIENKNKDAHEKLKTINTLIDERKKNKNTAPQDGETIFSKTLRGPVDQWNKQLLIDADLPGGLIYQVQIGVYKNAILPEIFKGLTPVFGKTVNEGMAYSTGMFEKLIDASQARDYVKSMGLKDAFVIAYYNKKKISIPEAAKLEK